MPGIEKHNPHVSQEDIERNIQIRGIVCPNGSPAGFAGGFLYQKAQKLEITANCDSVRRSLDFAYSEVILDSFCKLF